MPNRYDLLVGAILALGLPRDDSRNATHATALDALMYCAECRETGRFPWNHTRECVAGLRQRLRLYETGFGWLLAVIIAETVLLLVLFKLLGAYS